MINRMDRINKLIAREISVIIQTEIEDPMLAHVTISNAEVTKDLGYARVYFILEGDKQAKENVKKALRKHAAFIRGELASRVSLKHMPRLDFIEDVYQEYKDTIDMLFRKIETEHGADHGDQPPADEDMIDNQER